MVELRFLIVELRYLGVDWDCLKISYDFKENLKIDFHQGLEPYSDNFIDILNVSNSKSDRAYQTSKIFYV